MIVYPAMDLMKGGVVRLRQGKFNESTLYATAPADALLAFAEQGFEWAHVVDLDGAREKMPVQHELIANLARSSSLKLQVGGGFRTRDQVEQMLASGVERVVIGSLAVVQPALVNSWIDEFGPERLTLSLDVRVVDGVPNVAVSGWTEESSFSLWDIAALYPKALHLLITDIGRDGMMQGPNFDLLDEAVDRLGWLRIQASGGVTSIEDLKRLRTDGAIIGKALWEGRLDPREVLSLARA